MNKNLMDMIANYPYKDYETRNQYIYAGMQLLVMLYLGIKGGECGIVYISIPKLSHDIKLPSIKAFWALIALERQGLIKKTFMPETTICEIIINAEKLAKAQCYEK